MRHQTSKNDYFRYKRIPEIVTSFRCGPETVAKNLMNMTYGSTIGEIMSLRVLIKLLIEKEHVSPSAIK